MRDEQPALVWLAVDGVAASVDLAAAVADRLGARGLGCDVVDAGADDPGGQAPRDRVLVVRAAGAAPAQAAGRHLVEVRDHAQPAPRGVVRVDPGDAQGSAGVVVDELERRGLLAAGGRPGVYGAEEERLVADRLQALGYIE